MFGGLLGGKFSNKCKHAVKCIKARMGPIRNRKQASVRILRKDVANLIATGHEAKAFEKIDLLIVDINRISCYDMIEQLCEYILNQLPSLQKQRDCLPEAMKAISTLIFAAARFSDLPELCDLRHVFTERYESQMESFVDAEFVEKFQKKSFPKEKKLQLMQNIADEFSIRWDSKTFGHQSHNAMAHGSTQPKDVAPSHTENNGALPAQAMIQEAIRSKGKYGSNPIGVVQRRQVAMESDNIQVISAMNSRQSHDLVEKAQKVVVSHDRVDTEPYQTKNAAPSYVKPRRDHDGIHKDDPSQSRAKKVQNELDPSTEKQEVGSMKSWNVKPGSMDLPCTKSNGDEYLVEETRRHGMVPPYTKVNEIKNGNHVDERSGNVPEYDSLQRHEEVSHPTGIEKRSVRPATNNGRTAYVIPPYVKPRFNDVDTNADKTDRNTGISLDKSDGTEDADHRNDQVVHDEKPKPVSVRRKFRKPPVTETNGSTIDVGKPTSHTPGGQRRYKSRPSTNTNDDNYVEEKATIKESRPPIDDEMDTSIDYGKLLPRASDGRRRHGGRHIAAVNDEEEMAMDNLLLRYSRKGAAKEPSKERTRARTPTTKHVDPDRVEYPGNDKIHPVQREKVPPPERIPSLPMEPVTPARVKEPARVTSMQPSGGRVPPKLPEYDYFAARLTDLKKT
ncbi:unnamed protein product [Musa textilis]